MFGYDIDKSIVHKFVDVKREIMSHVNDKPDTSVLIRTKDTDGKRNRRGVL